MTYTRREQEKQGKIYVIRPELSGDPLTHKKPDKVFKTF